MPKVCLKCGYEWLASDIAPEYECPKCGVVYAKYERKLQSELATSSQETISSKPIPDISDSDEPELKKTRPRNIQKKLIQEDARPERRNRPNKNCPFCGESILLVAVKCRYCGSSLSDAASLGHTSLEDRPVADYEILLLGIPVAGTFLI